MLVSNSESARAFPREFTIVVAALLECRRDAVQMLSIRRPQVGYRNRDDRTAIAIVKSGESWDESNQACRVRYLSTRSCWIWLQRENTRDSRSGEDNDDADTGKSMG
jgi:hypothetical protein